MIKNGDTSIDVKQMLLDNDLEGTSYFDGDDYTDAIMGYTDGGNLVYSYELMIDWLMRNDGMDYTEAQEWIDYNPIRVIPYMDDPKPIIVYGLIK